MRKLYNYNWAPGRTKRGYRSRYDWDRLLNGSTWKLEIGKDTSQHLPGWRSFAHTNAKRRNKTLKTHRDGNFIIIQAVDFDSNGTSQS